MPDQESAVEIRDKIHPTALGKDDLVHAYAERRTVHVERCQTRPCDMCGKLDHAVARADEVVQGLWQPAAVPLLQDRDTRNRGCFRQATRVSHCAPNGTVVAELAQRRKTRIEHRTGIL